MKAHIQEICIYIYIYGCMYIYISGCLCLCAGREKSSSDIKCLVGNRELINVVLC